MSESYLLENNLREQIRTLFLDGNDYITICEKLEIPKGTWENYFYLNKYGFRDFITKIKSEMFLKKAESVSNKVLAKDDEGNAKILAIQQKEAEFLRETLGKDIGYCKRPDSVNININKNEPLDDKQKALLQKLLNGETVDQNVLITSDMEVIESKPKLDDNSQGLLNNGSQ